MVWPYAIRDYLQETTSISTETTPAPPPETTTVNVEIRYKPGPEMYLADTLSRAYQRTTDRSSIEKEVERIYTVDFLAISEPQLVEKQLQTLSYSPSPKLS